ncbi:MAG TPA: methionine adenosyltransferase [Thermoplasmatales archaeon]|nr:methionine adenosyltransferase [Thermoplasmatales archaeon]
MARTHILTSESVTEGHPDKMCDLISDAILDDALRQDPDARVAIETATKNGGVMVFGEMTTTGYIDVPHVVRETVKEIGYTKAEYGIEWETCSVWVQITEQSPDISQGVTRGEGLHKEQGAGDQGMMFGYACNETKELMPLPIMLAHKLAKKLADVRKNGVISYLRPDGKSQVSIEYDSEGKPLRAHTIVLSTQHEPGIAHEKIKEDLIEKIIKPVCKEWIDEDTRFFVNPTGSFVRGGPYADAGLTGR